MTGARVRVAANRYGVVGKRVADAVDMQNDMQLVGVADVATERGHPVLASDQTVRDEMQGAGIPVAGTHVGPLGQDDIVADCAPKKLAAANNDRYQAAGPRAIRRRARRPPNSQCVDVGLRK